MTSSTSPRGLPRVLTVNVGHPAPNPWKRLVATGFDKRPVAGPVTVSTPGPKGNGDVGLAGDHAYDEAHHGGSDQAVYAYAREDLDGWEPVLGRSLPHGGFGENVTTAGLEVTGALIGERWRIGRDVVLEVSCPRIPCVTFEGWFGRPGWIKEFLAAAIPGAYLRVITEGEIAAGDTIEVIHRPDHDVTIGLTFRAVTLEPHLLPRLLPASALPPDLLRKIRRRV